MTDGSLWPSTPGFDPELAHLAHTMEGRNDEAVVALAAAALAGLRMVGYWISLANAGETGRSYTP